MDRAGAEEEHVEEAFARPGFDVETVGAASRDRIGHARGQQKRAAALGGPGADAACGGESRDGRRRNRIARQPREPSTGGSRAWPARRSSRSPATTRNG